VRYYTPVNIKERKINEWLTAVEQEMRITLAKLLAQAVKDIAEFRSTSIDQQQFMSWVDRYQAQLVVLASQIRFLSKRLFLIISLRQLALIEQASNTSEM